MEGYLYFKICFQTSIFNACLTLLKALHQMIDTYQVCRQLYKTLFYPLKIMSREKKNTDSYNTL